MEIVNPIIGADIEVFLRDKESGEIISAEGYIKGDKYNPHIFDAENPFFAVSLDNVAAEFCIPPAHNVKEWLNYINKSMTYINDNIPSNFCTAALPAANLHERFLQTENAKRFGCQPDFNAWLKKVNKAPRSKDKTLRSCGGHIHVGYDNAAESQEGWFLKECIIKAMDLWLGIPSVIQEPDNKRKELYGKAGAFRSKDYGVEYRTISNYYLADEELTAWAYNNTMLALDFLVKDRFFEMEAVGDTIQAAINTCDKTLAGNLIRQFDIPMV